MKFYNSYTKSKEEFSAHKGNTVGMYSCGPTVYNIAHVGNLRTYVFVDILRRALKLHGFKVEGVMNITDVGHMLSDADEGEDKMVKAAREAKKTPFEIAESNTKIFFRDLKALNICKPEITPKATDHIKDMLAYVRELEKKGYAYFIPGDGVYFDTAKFADYGKLNGQKPEDQLAGARIAVNKKKRNFADFALWKIAEPEHIMQWQSRWGQGYPGWHIECSAMSEKYLGDFIDIHTGGVDHIPIHHENEIAQSEAKNGHRTVNFWMHGEFMLVSGGKMSKSIGNTYTLAQLKDKGFDPLDFRYFCLNAHYRQKLNFTFESLSGAKTALGRLREAVRSHKDAKTKTAGEVLNKYKEEFLSAVDDDLNIPAALGGLWKLVKEPKSRGVYALALYMDKIFGLNLDKEEKEETLKLSPEVKEIIAERNAARAARDFAKSDVLRKKLEDMGYKVLDGKDGTAVL